MRLFFRSLAGLFLALLVGGCFHDTVLPQTAALSRVHETYEREFLASNSLANSGSTAIVNRQNGLNDVKKDVDSNRLGSSFLDTLAEIKNFRTAFNGRKDELKEAFAHLDVLEGMVYLQAFEFGNARAAKARVADAAKNLESKTGLATRDKLFALSYASLLDGWEQTYRDLDPAKEASAAALDSSAHDIATILKNNVPSPNDSPEVDSAAGYLALSAGMFWAWVHELYATDCVLEKQICTREIKNAVDNGTYYCNAARALHPYLSDTEQAIVDGLLNERGADAPPQRPVAGRLTVIRWQAWFRAKAGDGCDASAPIA